MPTIADLVTENPTGITLFPLREQWRVIRGKRRRFPDSEGTEFLLQDFMVGVYSSSQKAEAEQERREAGTLERLGKKNEEEKRNLGYLDRCVRDCYDNRRRKGDLFRVEYGREVVVVPLEDLAEKADGAYWLRSTGNSNKAGQKEYNIFKIE